MGIVEGFLEALQLLFLLSPMVQFQWSNANGPMAMHNANTNGAKANALDANEPRPLQRLIDYLLNKLLNVATDRCHWSNGDAQGRCQ